MRILYICHRLPYPPKRGGKIRPFNMIRHFTAAGHEVSVCSIARDAAEVEDGRDLERFARDVVVETISTAAALVGMVGRVPTGAPSSFGYFWSPSLARRVRQLAESRSFDLAFVHCSSAAPYALPLAGMPRILDFGDMDSQKWVDYGQHRSWPLSWGYRLEGWKLERVEASLASTFDTSTCTTRGELETLRALAPHAIADWFPNGVDMEYFRPARTDYDPDTICFVGRMDYFPNQAAMLGFCADVWPRLLECRPALRLVIVGADPSARIRRLAKLPGVSVTGTVPDVRPLLTGAALTIAPLSIARGTQNKILESMALGVPVVTSPMAAKGVDVVPGEHLLVAGGPAEWADAILGICGDAATRRKLAEAARDRVATHHSWGASLAKLDGIVERTVHRQPSLQANESIR